jgi:hypothetical protein
MKQALNPVEILFINAVIPVNCEPPRLSRRPPGLSQAAIGS